MELLSLNVSQRIMAILYAVDSDESAMRMEESITTFILASTRLSLSTRTAFDYFGTHGNIKSVRRTPNKVFDYVGKDGDIRLDHGEPPTETRSRDGNDSNKWHDIISCSDKESFLSAVREQAPRDWLLSNQRILEYANLYYPEEKPEYTTPNITVERERYPEISEWENQAAIGDCRPER